ncbi:uracil-DNA glycosylase [Virgibacillus sp. 179-BFC.A HS]|uniref:Uracil-DNA glycosylase n=1 Tax=Tigheibacillus jepli TaxID=3035914 RepID=A0ABU5CGR0_9BACI|nr:uracil-DNA glycosylase [Virgibacillus sp. 179-BFC.A HS]MDY0405029.1 uracil-DNA glycosylase [Virgibacillus sp. 179-BFC.A HS]
MTDFCPIILPENPTPKMQQDCHDCGLYRHGTRMIWGESNPHASIMVVLDNPGKREDKNGDAFVCGTRQTLQETVHDVSMDMKDLYITFILKRRPTKAYEKEVTRQICMQHLQQQLVQVHPKLIICLGNVAVQSFFGDPDADVKSLRGSWHDVRGMQTTVAYHPLAVRRRPNLRKYFLEDWELVAKTYRQMRA